MASGVRLRVGSLNVLYESYYQRFCKVGRVPLDTRSKMFLRWLPMAFESHDVLAFQEWPYGGEQAYWSNAVWTAAEKAGWALVWMDSAQWDGLLVAVDTSKWHVAGYEFRPFTPATGHPGTKHRGRVVLRHVATGVSVGMINAHVPWAPQMQQSMYNVSELFELVDPALTPHWFAVGDWNVEAPTASAEADAFYRACFPEGWVDATAASSSTTCMHESEMKIDYVAHGPSLCAEGVSVHPVRPVGNVQHSQTPPDPLQWFSDHSLVSATLIIPAA
eukprot:TRINITY_DN20343_c0_g2_i1.p1 TRINITY_DN20343_c0_g2~~TRINITY_DN20343_c0_g2_i1.p1  ORF type:complete len:275 (+),score=65.04 TRINITY_DN20343_c0_g2_i1:104-928(+)